MTPDPPVNVGPPRYWRDEIGEELKPAVLRYLRHDPLTERDIEVLRLYVSQWIDSPVWDANPHQSDDTRASLDSMRREAHAITTRDDLRRWSDKATDLGFDPW